MSGLGSRTRGKGLLLFAPVVIAVALAIAGVAVLTSQPQTSVQKTMTGPNFLSIPETDGLSLSLMLNSTVLSLGHTVGISITVRNDLPVSNVLPRSNDWPVQGLTLGPCETPSYPMGIGVARGSYSPTNVSNADLLDLFAPGTYNCPSIAAGVSSYDFMPLSDSIDLSQGSSPSAAASFEVSYTLGAAGSYDGRGSFSSFAPGVYTVVGGDEWGHIVLLHFSVVQGDVTGQQPDIDFSLSINATQLQPGRAVKIEATIVNPLSSLQHLPGGSDWALPVLKNWTYSQLCPSYTVVMILRGSISPADLAGAKTPLQTAPPGLVVGCPAFLEDTYTIQAHSDNASFFGGEAWLPMGAAATVSGYYAPGQTYDYNQPGGGLTITPFEPGNYTVVAGDEWGQLAMGYFQVAAA